MLKNLYRKTEKTRSKSLLILSAVQDTVNRTLNKQHTLPSFFLISSAVDGNENAIEKLLLFYEAYISKCCLRPFYDEYGNVYIVVDMELKGRIREALLKMICEFEIDEH